MPKALKQNISFVSQFFNKIFIKTLKSVVGSIVHKTLFCGSGEIFYGFFAVFQLARTKTLGKKSRKKSRDPEIWCWKFHYFLDILVFEIKTLESIWQTKFQCEFILTLVPLRALNGSATSWTDASCAVFARILRIEKVWVASWAFPLV